MFRKKTATERFVAEAKDRASQIAKWLEDRVDDAPDPAKVKDSVTDSATEALNAARHRMEQVSDWLTDFAEDMSDRAEEVVVVEEDEGGKGKVVLATAGAAAAGWYFFEPDKGPDRRARFAAYLSDLKERVLAMAGGGTTAVESDPVRNEPGV